MSVLLLNLLFLSNTVKSVDKNELFGAEGHSNGVKPQQQPDSISVTANLAISNGADNVDEQHILIACENLWMFLPTAFHVAFYCNPVKISK